MGKKGKKIQLFLLLGALILLFIINQILIAKGLYLQIIWLDKPMHFLGGFFTGLIGIYFLFLFSKQKISFPRVLFTSFLVAIIIGGLWEIFELNSETILKMRLTEKITSADTRSDLFFDILGSFFGAFLTPQKKESRILKQKD